MLITVAAGGHRGLDRANKRNSILPTCASNHLTTLPRRDSIKTMGGRPTSEARTRIERRSPAKVIKLRYGKRLVKVVERTLSLPPRPDRQRSRGPEKYLGIDVGHRETDKMAHNKDESAIMSTTQTDSPPNQSLEQKRDQAQLSETSGIKHLQQANILPAVIRMATRCDRDASMILLSTEEVSMIAEMASDRGCWDMRKLCKQFSANIADIMSGNYLNDCLALIVLIYLYALWIKADLTVLKLQEPFLMVGSKNPRRTPNEALEARDLFHVLLALFRHIMLATFRNADNCNALISPSIQSQLHVERGGADFDDETDFAHLERLADAVSQTARVIMENKDISSSNRKQARKWKDDITKDVESIYNAVRWKRMVQ